MIDLYYFPTPNTWKVSIFLEESGLPYRLIHVDIVNDEQFEPAFLRISPNNRVPAIVDQDAPEGPRSVFESGAILVYLAEKTGRFLAASGPKRTAALEWLFWQMGGLGPMAGQAHHFRRYAPEGNDYGKERYTKEAARLYGVLDRRLSGRKWIADDYGIADMACWGWVWFHRMHGQNLEDFPEVKRWFLHMAERPAVQRARLVGVEKVSPTMQKMYEGPWWQLPEDYAVDETRVR
jgi:GSH-dependent disulfide-bond oxidoreductase